jgi:hydrophobe/amphiphile efflux-1 (HAE1) family protein
VSITDISIRNPVFAWMLMAVTILFGVITVGRIGISQYPDVDYPSVSVSVSYPGASPAAVEREVIEPLEQAMAQVEGVQEMTSSARPGSARISVSFDISRDVDLALQDIQARVAQAQRQLPKDVPAVTVSKSNPDDTPILTVGVYGAFSRQLLADVARYQVQEKLQTVPGVGQITLEGYLNRNVRLWLDASRLAEKGVVASDIISALQREHVEVPGGQIDAGGRQIDVRLLGEAFDLEELRKLVVRRIGETPVYLEDVALVEDGFEDRNSVARLDGVPLQALGILKQRGTNAVVVAEGVRARVDEIQASLPEGMKVEVLVDSTVFIEQAVHHIYVELGLALILTALVCWLFLGSISSTINVVLAIPMSLLGTIAVIYFLGFTLNTFTLLGLSLAVGLVVDDAVMVLENIVRHGEMGKPRAVAASEGTAEIRLAALAATLAVVAIFLPVVFMGGVIGKYFLQFGVTLSVAVMLSYVEAITLAPSRSAQILNTSREGRGRLGRLVDRGFTRMERGYARVLGWALRHPIKVLLSSLALLAGSAALVPLVPVEFIPTQDQSLLNVRIQTEAGTSVESASELLAEAESRLARRPEVKRILSTLSTTQGRMQLQLVPPEERGMAAKDLSADIRRDLQSIAGIRASVQDPSQQGFGVRGQGYPIDFTVRGADWDLLVENALQLKEELEGSGFVTDVTTDYRIGAPEIQVLPDRRRATELGVSVSELGQTVSALVGGNTVGKFSSGGRRIDIRMRLLAAQRSRPEDIGNIRVRAENGGTVPLSLVTTQQEAPVLQTISRIDRERAISISANVAGGKTQQQAMEKVAELGRALPVGYRMVPKGQSSQLDQTTGDLGFALLVGILVAYMVLASQFNSFLHPVTVLTILPLALSGAVLGLLVGGKSLNVFSMIGVLLLMGIVKKNSILLVEYANQVRERGAHGGVEPSAAVAMHEAGPLRLRPILMTTIATMMAAIPAALGLGAGSETRSPMAAAVLGGLVVSTVLSLLVVPAFYVVVDRGRSWVFRKGGGAG